MKKIMSKLTFFKELKLPIKIMLIGGIFFIVLGTILIFLSFRNEVLDDNYVITDVTEYINEPLDNLSPGEVRAIVTTEYQEQGEYKLIFQNYAQKLDNADLIREGSYFSIIDILGKGYELDQNRIIINEKTYKLVDGTVTTDEGIIVDYQDNILYIDLPPSLLLEVQNMEFYITLTERELFFEYVTTQDTYFNLIPSEDNDFYTKKESQSYMMDGYGYIKLNQK